MRGYDLKKISTQQPGKAKAALYGTAWGWETCYRQGLTLLPAWMGDVPCLLATSLCLWDLEGMKKMGGWWIMNWLKWHIAEFRVLLKWCVKHLFCKHRVLNRKAIPSCSRHFFTTGFIPEPFSGLSNEPPKSLHSIVVFFCFPWWYSTSLLLTTQHPPFVDCYDLISEWLPLLLSFQLIWGDPSMLQFDET